MAKRIGIDPFTVAPDGPLAAEQEAVQAWVEDAAESLPVEQHPLDVDLKSLASGRKLLAGSPEQSRRYVLTAETASGRMNVHQLPGRDDV